jgi:hypothetical protein
MNEVSAGNISVHTQLAIRFLHSFKYMENKNPLLQNAIVANNLSFSWAVLSPSDATTASCPDGC